MFGSEGTTAEFGQCLLIYQRSEIVVLKHLDLLNLMGCAETIEEIDKRNTTLDGSEMCYTGQVHNLLYRTFGQHGEAGLAG